MPLHRTLLLAVLIASGSTAYADDCTVDLDDARADFGSVFGARIGDGHGAIERPIASIARTLTVRCDRAQPLSVRLDATSTSNDAIPLGQVASAMLTVTRIMLDGKAVGARIVSPTAPPRSGFPPFPYQPGDTLAPTLADQPIAGRQLDIALSIDVLRTGEAPLNQATTVTSDARFRLLSHR